MVNKALKQYLSKSYPMVLIPDENSKGYVVAFPDLPGCLSYGENVDECITMGNEAKEIWLESMLDQGNHINEPNTISVDTLSKYDPAKSKSKGMILQEL